MPIEFDIESDVIYQRGRKQGKEEGKKAMIVEMLTDGTLSLAKIASYAKTSIEDVIAIQQEINTK